jgi:hypothetical protein
MTRDGHSGIRDVGVINDSKANAKLKYKEMRDQTHLDRQFIQREKDFENGYRKNE